jgi:hypothetical protein
MKNYCLLLLLIFTPVAFSEVYLGKDLSSWPQTEARKVKNDFAAWLLVTPDIDWQDKWDTPPDTIPYFNEASEVSVGDHLVILTFFTNPGVNNEGGSTVKCALRVERPDGTMSIPKQEFDCLKGQLQGNPRNVRLSPAVIQFTAEKSDLVGVWKVFVTLEDTIRKSKLELKTSYELLEQ